MSIAPHEIRFSPLTQIVRRRLLPAPGEVLVHVGDRVQAGDVVARASVEGQLYAIDLAHSLGIGVRAASRHVRISEGQSVTTDTILASARRFWIRKREVRAPFQGLVRGIHDGRVFLRQDAQTISLRAYVPGEIIERYPHRGVSVRAVGSLVRGIWGSGGERQGTIVTMVAEPGDLLTWEQVGIRYRGTILVGGVLQDPRVLYRARQFRLYGLIVGSMLPSLQPICRQLPLPVVVTEGMGHIPMAEPLFDLLRSHHGRLAIISGSMDSSSGPEVIVPQPPGTQVTALTVACPVEVGTWVRLTRAPYLGIIGQVLSVSATPQKTAIGTQAEGAEVRLPNGQTMFVPYVNMESLG